MSDIARSRTGSLTQRKVNNLRLLDQGSSVTALHKTLQLLQFSIADEEVASGRFGSTTHSAVARFQRTQGMEPTGIADKATLSALSERAHADEAQEQRTRWRRSIGALRRTSRLDVSSGEIRVADRALTEELRDRRAAAVREYLMDLFDQPSERLATAINNMSIDIDDIVDLKVSEFVFSRVVPLLLEDASLEPELFAIARQGIDQDSDTVGELLGLDQDVRDDDALRELVNRVRNAALGDIVALDDDAIDAVGNADLHERCDALFRLTEEGSLSDTQRDRMLVAADLARLTGDNFDAVRALIDGGVNEARELVNRDRNDWLRFIEDNGIELPRGDTADQYADVLATNIERAFPTAYAMTRFAVPAAESTLEQINVLSRLPDIEDGVFVDDGVRGDIDLSALSDSEAAAVRSDLNELAQFANRYAGLGVKEILNDRSVNVSRKREHIARRHTALSQAWRNRPNLDLRTASFTPLADTMAQAFSVQLDDIDPADRSFVRNALRSMQRVLRLSDAFDEADALMAAGLDDSIKIVALGDADELVERTGLPPSAALRIRAHAVETRTRMLHFVHGLEDTAGHAAFLPSTLNEAGAAGGPGSLINVLQDLPGYSELFGPQNYCKCRHCQSIFGPAAYFVDLMRFIDRKISRPNFTDADLTDHPLYLRNRRGDLWTLQLTCEHTDTPVLYLVIVNEVLERYLQSVDPLDGDVWEILALEARSSFLQPFNLPHAQMLLYLEHLGVNLADVSSLFNDEHNAATYARLGISPQELATLTAAEPEAVRLRFAKPFTQDLAVHDTAVLTRQADVSREFLQRLLDTDFVRGDVQLETIITSETNDLVGFVENLHIDVPEGADNDATLRAFLDRLHRFVRLQRALGWTPEELQIAIDAFRARRIIMPGIDSQLFGAVLNNELLTALADLKRLMDGMQLSVSEAVALCHEIPDAAAEPDNTEVSPGFGTLQGALRISEPDLINLLLRELPDSVITSGVIAKEHLNRLYRTTRLARALDVSQDALAVLSGILPNLSADIDAHARLSAQIEVMAIAGFFDDLGLSIDALVDHLEGSLTAASDAMHAAMLLGQIHAALRDDERLWLTPTALAQIEGITPAAARVVVRHLLDQSAPWLVQPDETLERYLLTDAANLDEIDPTLLEALSVPGGPLEGVSVEDPATNFLSQSLRRQLLHHAPRVPAADAMADALNLSGDVLDAFDGLFAVADPLSAADLGLSAWLQATDDPPPARLSAYVVGLVRIRKLLIDTLSASREAVEFIATQQTLFEITPLSLNDTAPPDNGWNRTTLWRLAFFCDALRGDEDKSAALRRALDAWDGTAFPPTSLTDLAVFFDVTVGQIEALRSELPVDEDAFATLQRIGDGVALTARTGLDPTSLSQLVSETFADTRVARDLVHGAMRINHPTEEAWRTVENAFIEKVEGLKRDALVDRILSRPELRFDNARDIYHFFLLDPQMDGCFVTSRVKNAISSCQLYVQRCLMGLEQSEGTPTSPSIRVKVKGRKKTREEWEWRKNYRVWEANRKVFLYPENYMLPDLRDDRSHIFKLAESDLLQGNLDDDTIEKVFQRYLAEFVQVGGLVVVHVLREKRDYVLFGRTEQEPYRYFMRRFNGRRRWEPWEPIELDIGARTISAVTKRGKLYLFWTNVELEGDADKAKAGQPDVDPGQAAASDGESDQTQETFPVTISYATRNEQGAWSAPRDFLYYNLLLWRRGQEKNRLLPISNRIYAEYTHVSGSTAQSNSGVEKFIRLIHPVSLPIAPSDAGSDPSRLRQYLGFLRESDNTTIRRDGLPTEPMGHKGSFYKWTVYKTPGLHYEKGILWRIEAKNTRSTVDVDYIVNGEFKGDSNPGNISETISVGNQVSGAPVLDFDGVDHSRIGLRAVQRKTREIVLHAGDLQYLVKLTGKPGLELASNHLGFAGSPLEFYLLSLQQAKWRLVSLTTGAPARLSNALFNKRLNGMLSPNQQYKTDAPTWESGVSFQWIGQIKPTAEDLAGDAKDRAIAHFSGVHGNYLWEIHFHLPFLIAHTLNSVGRFEEADHWYRYIFDPTTADEEPDAHWRFVVFRTLKLPKLRAILTQTAAIKAYKNDPFNPFAIARLRPAAFQKTIVMRYIDNLLDWGDERFRIDTRESINEALLLYTMAADLLGERPIDTGECEVAESFSYADIELRGTGSEFLVELENIVYFYVNLDAIVPVNPIDPGLEFAPFRLPGSDPTPPEPPSPGSGFTAMTVATPNFQPYAAVRTHVATLTTESSEPPVEPFSGAGDIAFQPDLPPDPDPPFEPTFDFTADDGDDPDPDGPVLDSRMLGFCVPPNETLLGYWDRVEDRLHKLRHCMNIEGVVRTLSLWQPPIDPMLLVRAKAAGLELDDVLALINEQPPHHRFEILHERARRFAGTAQQLGSQLLSALERKDDSELTLLRSVHEDAILNLSRRQKQDATAEAKEAHKHLKLTEKTIQARIDHYEQLIGSDETETPGGNFPYGMIDAEKSALDEMQDAKDRQASAGEAESKAQRYREIGPQWTAGGSFSVGYHGKIVRASVDTQFAWGSTNIEARFQRRAFGHRDASSKHSASAGMASTTAGHLRRLADWKLQRKLARRKKFALQRQIAAADIRIALAEKELETHDLQIKNSRELYDFAKERFTDLGLYTYLSTTLSRLYREAYDMALKMAQSAERAYRFEIGEDSFFVKLDNWTASRAGLLAADRLLLQLQQMEAAFVERDRRRQEVILPCALSQFDPDALLRLRRTGRAEFTIPEWWFDLYYPGQYRRMLQAVQVTIPCVTGPYANVSAKLMLVDSVMRTTANLDDGALAGVQIGRNTSISTSSAKSDPGVFELRFDGPKNPPFKGAGAVSSWVLELPQSNHVFDYASIADAIIELSYTAEDDGLLKQAVEGMDGEPGTVDALIDSGLIRTVSLRHDFPDAFHNLVTMGDGPTGPIDIPLTRHRLFPQWLWHRQIEVTQLDIALEPESGRSIAIGDLQGVAAITANGESLSSWAEFPQLGSLPVVSSAVAFELDEESTVVSLEVSLPDTVELRDILVRLTYRADP